jgi:glycosyltransferase involved in cell wall biosynthesis
LYKERTMLRRPFVLPGRAIHPLGESVTERTLRIVHVIGSVDPNAGGPATVVTRIAAAQAAHGHEVVVISSLSPSRIEAFRASVASIPGLDRINFQLSDRPVSPADLLKPGFWRQLKQAIANADAVHLHGVWELGLLAAARVARKHSVPYVVRPCGMLDPWSLAQRNWKKRLALRVAYRRMLQGAASLHVLNETEARLIEPLKLAAPRNVIPNGIFLEEIPADADDSLLQAFPALQGKRYMLFLSRLHFKKGLDLLAPAFIGAAAADSEIHMVVAGADHGAKAAFVRAIQQAGLEHRVHLVGELHGAIKYSALRHADCFCLPSRQEGFSLAVTEALACGTPVVISRDTHFPEAATAGAGIETDLDPANIQRAMLQVIQAPEAQRRAMGLAGRLLVRQRFTWPRVANMTLDLYGSFHERRPANRAARNWTQARRSIVPALRAAGLTLTWFLLDITIGR